MASPKIFYFYTRGATFIEKDLAMLRTAFEVREHAFPAPEKWKTPLLFASQLLFLLRHFPFGKKAVLMTQFAGYHSFIPCLWGRFMGSPTLIVVGGTDCVAFPSLRYGHFQNRLLAWFTRASYRLVDTVSAVHHSLFYRDNPYAGPIERYQGIRHFFPAARFRENEIPNGFDTQLFRPTVSWTDRPVASFVTIAVALDDGIRVRLKGIDLVLELAAALPEAQFTFVGVQHPDRFSVPPNVGLLPYQDNAGLHHLYNQHRYYLQLSLSEGFPNALCEAMASGCYPIVSEVASMPEIVGENGLRLPERNTSLLVEKVRALLAAPDSVSGGKAVQASASIFDRYSWENRRNGLVRLIRGLARSEPRLPSDRKL
jgi:glycosyltransferase involved in cell wall biosynthesis